MSITKLQVLGRYKMFNIEKTPYNSITYDFIRRQRLVHSFIYDFMLEKLKNQGITEDDILAGKVEIVEYPRADITGEQTPKGFMRTRFVKMEEVKQQ
jgi:hypothetical protein